MEPKKNELLYKVVSIGTSGVGKTSLLLRYVDDTFNENTAATIGVDFFIRRNLTITYNGRKCFTTLQLWDTAGQERYHTITTAYFRGASAIIFIFSLAHPETLNDYKRWISHIEKHARNPILVAVGNKSDLPRAISNADITTFRNENHFDCYYETSAKTGDMVEEMFQHIANLIAENCSTLEHDLAPIHKPPIKLNEPKNEEEEPVKKKCC